MLPDSRFVPLHYYDRLSGNNKARFEVGGKGAFLDSILLDFCGKGKGRFLFRDVKESKE